MQKPVSAMQELRYNEKKFQTKTKLVNNMKLNSTIKRWYKKAESLPCPQTNKFN